MSKDKARSRTRRLELLSDAVAKGGGLRTNCQGGMSSEDPDLQRLVADGHMRISRESIYMGGTHTITTFKITPLGQTWLADTNYRAEREKRSKAKELREAMYRSYSHHSSLILRSNLKNDRKATVSRRHERQRMRSHTETILRSTVGLEPYVMDTGWQQWDVPTPPPALKLYDAIARRIYMLVESEIVGNEAQVLDGISDLHIYPTGLTDVIRRKHKDLDEDVAETCTLLSVKRHDGGAVFCYLTGPMIRGPNGRMVSSRQRVILLTTNETMPTYLSFEFR